MLPTIRWLHNGLPNMALELTAQLESGWEVLSAAARVLLGFAWQLSFTFCVENWDGEIMFQDLEMINNRPQPFEFYTANDLWTNEHTSKQMLKFHLNEQIDVSSRNAEFINRSVEWICSKFDIGRGFKIADFGCGPGLYTTQLAKRGADITGIDFSKSSIQYAQQVADKEGLSINYVNQDYLDYEPDDRFHLIIMIMCDFCALSPIQRNLMLKKFHLLVLQFEKLPLLPDQAFLLSYSQFQFHFQQLLLFLQLSV